MIPGFRIPENSSTLLRPFSYFTVYPHCWHKIFLIVCAAMSKKDRGTGKRKALEALGCSLYVIAFLIMGAVLLAKCGKI